jgi:integrase
MMVIISFCVASVWPGIIAMNEKLTDRYLAKYQRSDSYPPLKRVVIYDKDLKGFCIVVQPSGVISFKFRYRRQPDGASREYKLGRVGSITAAQARKEASLRHGEANKGLDIQELKKDAKLKAERDRLQTLQVFFDEKYRSYCEIEMRSGRSQIHGIQSNFVKLWPNIPLKEINTFRVQNWRREKLKAGVSAGGINRPVSALKAMLNRAVEWNAIESNPLAALKPLKEDSGKNVRFLSAEEESALRETLEARQLAQRLERARYNEWLVARKKAPLPEYLPNQFTDYVKPLVLLALNTGMRRGELFNLVIEDVELNFGTRQEGRIVVRGAGAKSGNSRNIPLTTEARALLKDWIRITQPTGLLFPSPVTGERLDNITSAWGTLIKSAGIKKFRFHDLRHTFASKLAMRGVDLYTIKEFLGHASIDTTQRYAHLGPDHKSAAISKLND